jgi:quercetin dioxygenase-like cupin family protein
VVYEGLDDAKFDIDEQLETKAVLSYARSKVQSEIDIKMSGKNYIITRLASVYGYSNDSMRINIMPNLFSKITALDGTISLFSGGKQYKSLVCLYDVVRALKFLAESSFNKETYHLSNASVTIKEVAEICKKINPKVTLVETNDEIPNLGYTISNKKLLSTGFKFLYSLETSIKEMYQNWSIKQYPEDLEFKIKGEKEYIDSRGKISNYELTEPINLIGYIESKEGSVRANHYHPIQEQKCLLISGKYISVTKDLSDKNSVIETRIINKGDIAVIRPNVAHTMVFLEDSIFLNLVRGEREHENYGITHTIPYELVDEKMRLDLIKYYKYSCRCCGNDDLKDVLSLGMSPLANNLLNSEQDKTDLFPLEVKYCDKCHNSQLSVVISPEKMFDNYLYVSSTAISFRKHFELAAEKYINEFNLNSDTLVLDIGSNDGIFLTPLKNKGIKILGVEPAKNISNIANNNGIETINSYFDSETAKLILHKYGKAKLVTASNVFAHSNELFNIATEVFNLLEDDGVFIVEVQYLLDTIKDLTFDNIYHEHVNYWSVISINNFFKKIDLQVFKVEHINTHGGSIRVYIRKEKTDIDKSVSEFIDDELKFGLSNYDTYKIFAKEINKIKENTINNILNLKSKYKIAAYGSPAKATTALNFFGINNNIIDYTIEDNDIKNNKIIPGVNIPIKNKDYCYNNLPDIIIVLAWNFFDEIKNNNKKLIDMGVKFISIKELQNENFDFVK